MRFLTICDNVSLYPHLAFSWGYSCLVGDDLLFDTGGNSRTLLSNLAKMGIDPEGIRTVVLSHAHGDHTGGLGGLLGTGICPTVYVPRAFTKRFKDDVHAVTALVEVHEPMEIRPGVHTTGEMGRGLVEQALAVVTEKGLVVITGCAHPGVVKMVRCVKEILAGEIYLVMGGFHLGSASRHEVRAIVADLEQLGVRKVAPCHCTGTRAMPLIAEAYGDDFIENGVGMLLDIGE